MASGMNSASDSLGGYISGDPLFASSVLEAALAQSVALNLFSTIPAGRQKKIYLPKEESLPTPGWVSETGGNSVKQVSDMSFGRDELILKEIAGICTVSDVLQSSSFASPDVISIVKRALSRASSDAIDRALLKTGSPDTDGPQSFFDTGDFQELAYDEGGHGDLGEHLRLLLRMCRTKNFEPSGFLMHPTALDALLAIRTEHDLLKYPSVESSQRIWNKNIYVSNNLEAVSASSGLTSNVVCGDFRLATVAVGNVELRVSDSAMLDMGGGNMVSMFQSDKQAIRIASWCSGVAVRRSDAFAVCTDVIAEDIDE